MGGIDELISAAVLGVFRARPAEEVWRWAAREIWISEKWNPAHTGFYDPDLTPYAQAVHDFIRDDSADELHIEKSSQVGITQAALNMIAWAHRFSPGPTAYVIDTREEARNIAERLKDQLGLSDAEERDLNTFRMDLGSMVCWVSGAGADSIFRNKALTFAVLDEVENHPLNRVIDERGSTIDRMRSRFTTSGGKLLTMSKAGIRGGPINREVESGTLEKFWVPCPHCGGHQVLEDADPGEAGRQFPRQMRFGQLKDLAGEWDFSRFELEAFWECLWCKGKILWHEHQRAMVAAGVWRPTNLTEEEFAELPERERIFCRIRRPYPRRRSMRISDFYSPFERVCWGRLAQIFVEASKDEDRLKHLLTNHCAVAWEASRFELRDDWILALRSGLHIDGKQRGPKYYLDEESRVCPVEEPRLLTMTCDVQDQVFKWVIGAWDQAWSFWMMDFGEVTAADSVLGLFDRQYAVLGSDGVTRSVDFGMIDSGFRTSEVYELSVTAARMGNQLWPSMGTPGVDNMVAMRLKQLESGLVLERIDYSDHALKVDFYQRRMRPTKDAERVWLPTDVGKFPEFWRELQGEQLVHDRNRMGFHLQKWKRVTGTPNDYGDAMKMQWALMRFLRGYLGGRDGDGSD